ncbi:MAG TPA: phospholipase D-like domain-containing protein [Verrucomicrobiae bacterium]
MPAIAISNNDVAFIAWRFDQKIPNCLGFAIYRIDSTGAEKCLPAWVGFQGQSNPTWQSKTTAIWPVQKFTWRDLTATRGETYTYRIVPMTGAPDKLVAKNDAAMITNAVTITEKRGDFNAYFNRGILSTQSLSHQLPQGPNGAPNYTKLMGRIDQPGDPLRNSLSGQLREAMLGLFERAKAEGGEMFCALYELTDPELEQQLLAAKDFVHIILSNTGADDAENAPARQALHQAGIDITDRMVQTGHIGHNKFVVYVDKQGQPAGVWTGSTNWTDTGLCAQCNNGIWIESPKLAAVYRDYWNRLKEDDSAQGPQFRSDNDEAHAVKADGGSTDITLWFSPNTKQKNKPSGNAAATPDDMNAVFQAMQGAQEAILFLVFQPGSPSIVDQAADIQDQNQNLFIHGAATDPGAVNDFNTHLFHRTGAQTDTDVVAATAINDQFGYWEKELLKASPGAHAIIHDKIIVIDPFSPNCVVITGSHNLGYRASYNNDENLLIIRGNNALAAAYAVHVMDVYDHYRWRFMVQQKGDAAWTGLVTDDAWQDKYFKEGTGSYRELDFWMQAGATVNTAKVPTAKAAPPASSKKNAPAKKPSGRSRNSRASL